MKRVVMRSDFHMKLSLEEEEIKQTDWWPTFYTRQKSGKEKRKRNQ